MNVPSNWSILPFLKAFRDLTAGNRRVDQRDYRQTGALPVIDQGQDQIAGYVDDVTLACKAPLPCLVFGDHTKAVKYVEHPFAIGAQGVRILLPFPGLDTRFGFYALRNIRFPPGTGYSRHSRFLKRASITVPPLPEQRRITAILDKADAIRRKRQESLRLLDDFLRSAFVQIFGDPIRNEKGWMRASASSVIASIEAGSSVKGEERKQGHGEWAVLKISAVTSGWYLPAERKVVAAPPHDPVVPKAGDLLFSRANTRELVAATCLVDRDEERVFLPDKLWLIRPDAALATVEYLRFLLAEPRFRHTLTRHATGTSGSMLNVSQERVLRLDLPLPPLQRQRHFSSLVRKVFETRGRVSAATDRAAELFDSLAQRAFGGSPDAAVAEADLR